MLGGKTEENVEYFNLGTGNGVTVLELINTFEKATGVKVPHKIVGRREGDIEKFGLIRNVPIRYWDGLLKKHCPTHWLLPGNGRKNCANAVSNKRKVFLNKHAGRFS